MKKIVSCLIVLLVAMFGFLGLAMAQTSTTSSIKNIRQDANSQIKEIRKDFQDQIKDLRQDSKEDALRNQELIRKRIEERRVEIKSLMETRREEFRNRIESRREELKSQIEAKKSELDNRLTKIKDERKKEIIGRAYDQINELNDRRTKHFLAILEKLEKVLERVSDRVAELEIDGRDVGKVKLGITEAFNAIAASRTAIQKQAEKIYAPVIGTEETLKMDIGKIRQALHGDLVAVQETVKSAREIVQKTVVALSEILKADNVGVTTTSATTTQ